MKHIETIHRIVVQKRIKEHLHQIQIRSLNIASDSQNRKWITSKETEITLYIN